MSDELQRYFAAVLACAIAATWVAAGFGPALAGLIASAVAYGAVAVAQQRSTPRSRPATAHRQPQFRAPGRASRASSPRRGGPMTHTAQAPRRRPAPESPRVEAEFGDEPAESAAISARAHYGW